ncbi:MAG: hypothetical protein F6K63_03590 [Moorea sp. SIO1G6]|uniref:hypothetical protein n=1 Tax=Moorena sp. SIO1G6 TaxID=2607840 RepID=UPI0013BFCB94|nr:hypothetical protein [Moorena sp. SIO1G6]NET63530.1 hypothetical protein [Moorena sp. SIO1G6]
MVNLITGQAHRGSRESECPEKKITGLYSSFSPNEVDRIFALFSFPCSEIRCSLKPETLYLTKLKTSRLVTFTFWLLPCAFFAVVLL